jgi:hypothetical protein
MDKCNIWRPRHFMASTLAFSLKKHTTYFPLYVAQTKNGNIVSILNSAPHHEATHSAEVKNEWSYTSTPPAGL